MKLKMAFPQRKWVIRTLVIFLIIMALLTFFSNTIMNMSLPQVRTRYAGGGSLSSSITIEGPIEAITQEVIESPGDRVVNEVLVQLGEEVTAGQALVSLVALEGNKELTEAEKELESMKWSHAWDLKTREPFDYYNLEESIRLAQKTLQTARDTLTAVQNEPAVLQQIADLKKEIEKHEARELVLTDEIAALALSKLDLEDDTNPVSLPIAILSQEAAQLLFDAAKAAYDDAVLQGIATQLELDTLKVPLDQAEADLLLATTMVETLQQAYDAIVQQLADKNKDLTNTTALKTQAGTKVLELEGQITGTTVDDAKEGVRSAERTLLEAQKALDRQKLDNQKQSEQRVRDDAATDAAIAAQQKKVDELKAVAGTNVLTSPADGIVASVNVKNGDTIVPEMELVLIFLNQEGYTVKKSFPMDVAANMYVNMTARVDWPWQADRDAVITSIRVDPEAPSTNRLVTFRLTGKFFPGEMATLVISNPSRPYECVIPRSAIHEGSNGPFVYALRQKSSPLGMRYFAVQVNVSVLAEEGTQVAIDPSALMDYLGIITQSNKPISDGSQVRLADSNS